MGLKQSIRSARNYLASTIAYTGNNDYLQDTHPQIFDAFSNSTKSALKLSAFYSGVRLLSEVPASLPRMVYIDDAKGGKKPHPQHIVNKLLHKPNRFMNGVIYNQLLFSEYHIKGNHVDVIIRKGGTGLKSTEPEEILPIKWEDVRMFLSNGILYYEVSSTLWAMDKVVIPYFDVLHFKNFSENGLVGRSALEHAREVIKNGHYENNFQLKFWEKGGIARNVIESEKDFPTDVGKWNAWKLKYKEANGGTENNHGTIWLDGGKRLKQLQLPVPDQKFINLKTFTVQDICRFLGVPSHMVNDLVKSSYNTLEQQNRAWVQNRLRPDVKNIEEEMELKLFTDAERETTHIKYVLDGLLRGNMTEVVAVIHLLVTDGIISPDEARTIYLNLNPLGGDMAKPLTPAHIVGKSTDTEKAFQDILNTIQHENS